MNGADAAAAAELASLVRATPEDLCDPLPPASEMEVLSDAGARGKSAALHPWVAVEAGRVVAYGATDLSSELRRAQLVGPIVHPEFRRRGIGRALLDQLIDQARISVQRSIRGCVSARNAGGNALLQRGGFRETARHTRLRASRAMRLEEVEVPGIDVRRGNYDHAALVHDFVRKHVPRTEKQTRSLLKSTDYLVLLATKGREELVAVAEIDLRWGEIATVEHVVGAPELLASGLGRAMIAEAMRNAFERRKVAALDFAVEGNGAEQSERYLAAGFERRDELIEYARSL